MKRGVHVLVIGASRGIGLEIVKYALRAGHRVRAFSRSVDQIKISDARLEKRRGDALTQADIDSALKGVDVVVQALGVRPQDLFSSIKLFSEATRVLVSAMERHRITRLISITGFGAGDSKSAINCIQRLPFRFFLGRAYDDKDVQENLIKDSELDWTIVRPGVLVPGRGCGHYKILTSPSEWRNGLISRSDVAKFVVQQVSSEQYLRQAPVIVCR